MVTEEEEIQGELGQVLEIEERDCAGENFAVFIFV